MIRFILDQCIPRSTAKLLRESGWDVVHTGEIGLCRATDLEILEYARNEERIIVTLDADFHALLAVNSMEKPSVIRIRVNGLNGREVSSLLQEAWPKIENEIIAGAMASITSKTVRIKNLPI